MVEAIFTGFSILSANIGYFALINIPILTGIITITNNCLIIVTASTETDCVWFPKWDKANCTIIGIVIIDNKLEIAVKVTDKAKSPFARCVNKLDVAPPGQAARSIMPIAIVGDRLRYVAIKYPMIGKTTIENRIFSIISGRTYLHLSWMSGKMTGNISFVSIFRGQTRGISPLSWRVSDWPSEAGRWQRSRVVAPVEILPSAKASQEVFSAASHCVQQLKNEAWKHASKTACLR